MAKKGSESANTLNAQQYAAIHLRVPNSGTEWLDEMIQESRDLDKPAEPQQCNAKKPAAKKPAAKDATE